MMDNRKIAKELNRIAKELVGGNPKSIDDLSPEEQNTAKKFIDKGYEYLVQIETVDGKFGEPFYFKSPADVGPFLRSFPDYQKAKTSWAIKLV